MQQPTSSVGPGDDRRSDDGFTLLEVVCVMAILAMVAAVALPWLPSGTSRARLESYAVATAALLKSDRNAALRRQTIVSTEVNTQSRFVRSGVSGRTVSVPEDVAFEALLANQCNGHASAAQIRFFPSGMSCGGVIALTRSDIGYQVRVNWLTGGIEVVALKRT